MLNARLGSAIFKNIEKLIQLFKFTEDVRTYQFSHEEASTHLQRIFTNYNGGLLIEPSFLNEENYLAIREGVVVEIRGTWCSKSTIIRVNKTSTVESVLYDINPCNGLDSYRMYQHSQPYPSWIKH